MKFIQPFKGCKQGDLYPTQFAVGDECPPELEFAAMDVGAVAADKPERTQKAGNDGNPGA